MKKLLARIYRFFSYRSKYIEAQLEAKHYKDLYAETLESHLRSHIQNRELKRAVEYYKKRASLSEMFNKGDL